MRQLTYVGSSETKENRQPALGRTERIIQWWMMMMMNMMQMMRIIIVISCVNRSFRSTGPGPRSYVYGKLNNRLQKTTKDQGLNAETAERPSVSAIKMSRSQRPRRCCHL